MPSAPARVPCPRCGEAMGVLALAAHRAVQHRGPVTVDHCTRCRLVWFDTLESVQLDGRGWIALLREFQAGARHPVPAAAHRELPCPTCRAPLREVHNQTRFGRFRVLACPARHGHLQSASGLFAERGLVRPLLEPDRLALAEEGRPIHCFSCGAPVTDRSAHCDHCGSPLLVLDLPRLAHALCVQLDAQAPTPAPRGTPLAWACRGCGTALDPTRDTACPACGHLVVAPSLEAIEPVLEQAAHALDAAAATANGGAGAAAAPGPAGSPSREAAARPRRRPRSTTFGSLLHALGVDATPVDPDAARAGLPGWLPFAIVAACALLWWLA